MTQGTAAPTASAASAQLSVAVIKGRIKFVREGGGQRGGFLHVITLPAPDEWTPPQTVEVYSETRLGDPESVWQGRVRLGGYGRTWQREVEDPRTGEIRKRPVPTADNTLTALP
jgi:hypothetical protein